MKILRNINGANTETKVVYKNVTKIDVVCKKIVAKKIRNGLTTLAVALRRLSAICAMGWMGQAMAQAARTSDEWCKRNFVLHEE